MKNLLKIGLLVVAMQPLLLWAGNPDSLQVVKARWHVDSLDGMVLKFCHFDRNNCLGTNQFVAILELAPQSPRRLAFTHSDVRMPTSMQALRHKARAAINGSYFDMKENFPICYLRIDGNELGENTPQASDSINRKYYQYGGVSLRNGRPYFYVPDSNRKAEAQMTDSNIMTAGPMLIRRGKPLPMRADRTFVTQRHNRTAIATKADGTVLLVTVDGRTKQSQGLSLPEFQRLLAYLGCTDALNLDGGGSTTLYVKGRPHGGLVSHPSDNRRFDYLGERPVSNCIIVK